MWIAAAAEIRRWNTVASPQLILSRVNGQQWKWNICKGRSLPSINSLNFTREAKKIEGISSGDALYAFHSESLKRKLTAKDYTATTQTIVCRIGVVTAA
jgi:hypothetical protein